MAKLSELEKHQIVCLLAQFTSPVTVVAKMRDEYGLKIDRFQVRSYDPTNPRFEAGQRWREIFFAVRKTYVESVQAVPIAHKAYRLNELQGNYDRAKEIGNLVLANKTLEQSAKEVEGVLTKERTFNSQDDRDDGYKSLTLEEKRERVTEILKNAINAASKDRDRH